MCNLQQHTYSNHKNTSSLNPKLNMLRESKSNVKQSLTNEGSKYLVEEKFCSCCGIKLYNSLDTSEFILSSDEFGKTLAFPINKKEYLCEACYVLNHYKYISSNIFIPYKDGKINLSSKLISLIHGKLHPRDIKFLCRRIALWNDYNFTCAYCGLKTDSVLIITDRKIDKEEIIKISGFNFKFQTSEEFKNSSLGLQFKDKNYRKSLIVAKIGEKGNYLTTDHIVPHTFTKALSDNYNYLKKLYACSCSNCNNKKQDHHISDFAI